MAGGLPWLIFAATLLLASIRSSTASRMAKPGCIETCGNLTIPYPFGIGEGCFRERFDVSCENNTLYRHNSSSHMKIYDISLLRGQINHTTLIAYKCFYNDSNYKKNGWASLRTGELFTTSSKANKLTVVGCNTLAFVEGYNEHKVGAGCFSMCGDKQSVDDGGQCSGMGCCQTPIAPKVYFSNITFDDRFNNSEVSSFNPCSYAFVAEQDWFKFKASYLDDDKFIKEFKDGVPTVLDWVAGNESCNEAVKNMPAYACISKNSQCIDSKNATGYLCTCKDGFAGNPYLELEGGCQDIDECSFPDQYPCHGTCSNIIRSYTCSCKPGTRSTDPKRDTCNPIELTKVSTGVGVGIGLASAAGLIILFLTGCVISDKIKHRRTQMLKCKFYEQNRGQLLEQLVSQRADIAERMIIPLEELEKATNNFDKGREIGGGGHGTVYKGILSDLHVVAIKKPKKVVQREIDEFINEVAILS